MQYPKTVAKVTQHSEDDWQVQRLIFNDQEQFLNYMRIKPNNIYILEDDETIGKALDFDQLFSLMFKKNGKATD